MKYFLPTKLRGIKKPIKNKTKQISKRGKNKVWKGLEGGLWGFGWSKFFLLLFLSNMKSLKGSLCF